MDFSLTLLRVEDMKWIECSIFFHFEGKIFPDWIVGILLVYVQVSFLQ